MYYGRLAKMCEHARFNLCSHSFHFSVANSSHSFTMAKTPATTKKATTKTPNSKASAAKSKHSTSKKDRLTSAQKRRVLEFRASLYSNVKSNANATKLDFTPAKEQVKTIGSATTASSAPRQATEHNTSDAHQSKRTPKKIVLLSEIRRRSKDPPSDVCLFSGLNPHQRYSSSSAAFDVNKDKKRDPPNFIQTVELPKDPPTGNETEQTEPSTLKTSIPNEEEELPGATFSETLNWQWNILRRGLQALGLVNSEIAAGHQIDGEDTFFDAVDYVPGKKKYLVEDVSDEDEDILTIRRASLHMTPSRSQSWMQPVGSPEVSPRRYSKPDP